MLLGLTKVKTLNSKSEARNKFLIIKLSAIGEVVPSLPFVEVVSDRFNSAKIDWVVEEDKLSGVEGHPDLCSGAISTRL